MISKTQSITISFKENGYEISFYEVNPNFRERKYNRETEEYNEPHDPAVHTNVFQRKYVFTDQASMIAKFTELTAFS